jgi:hypothetical protein
MRDRQQSDPQQTKRLTAMQTTQTSMRPESAAMQTRLVSATSTTDDSQSLQLPLSEKTNRPLLLIQLFPHPSRRRKSVAVRGDMVIKNRLKTKTYNFSQLQIS